MDFISQYLLAHSGTKVPAIYHDWCALHTLAVAMQRRAFVDHGHYKIHHMMYVDLVGVQGNGKSTAKDQAHDMIRAVFPELPIGSDIMSREQIIKNLAGADHRRTFVDWRGDLLEYCPYALYINELDNFISFNPVGMIQFLTDVYDKPKFESETLKRGKEFAPLPCVTMLSCATPEWIITQLKAALLVKGFSRRVIHVYSTAPPIRITFPEYTEGNQAAHKWCLEHLEKLKSVVGPYQWTPDAREWFQAWHQGMPYMTNNIMKGFYEAKDVLATKVAMAYAMAQPDPQLLLTRDIMQKAVATLEATEENLQKLTIAVGRNELSVPQQQLYEYLVNSGGRLQEKLWYKFASTELRLHEYRETCDTFKKQDLIQFVEGANKVRYVYTMEEFVKELKAEKVQREAEKAAAAASASPPSPPCEPASLPAPSATTTGSAAAPGECSQG